MRLNSAGRMVARWWAELGNKFPHVTPETYIVVPNHFHGIVIITDPVGEDVGADLCVGPNKGGHAGPPVPFGPSIQGAHTGAPLPEIVQWFKTMTTNEYIREVKILGWPPFCGRLWQRNYHEHIIRDEASLNRIREYIEGNPARWAEDSENPDNVGAGPCAWGR